MTIKRRVFVSNTIMVCITLILLFAIGGSMVEIFKDQYYGENSNNGKLNEDVIAVDNIINNVDNVNFKKLAKELSKYEYRLEVRSKKEKIYTNVTHFDNEGIEHLNHKKLDKDEKAIYYWENATVVRKNAYINNKSYDIVAVNCNEEYQWFGISKGKFEMFVVLYGIIGILAVIVLILMSQLFTKNLANRIMEPVDELIKGSKRIYDGNMSEPIFYYGEEEFETVCNAFNEMQFHLKEQMDKNVLYKKARTEMISGISHDLRTPLTSVKGYIKGLKDGVCKTEEKKEKYIDIAYNKACEIDMLLERLFYFSKLETGNMPLFKTEINYSEYVEGYVKTKQIELEDKNIKISYKCNVSEHQKVLIDKEQIKRVYDNVIENSIKYSKSDNLEIVFNLSNYENFLRLEIKDNGNGVEEDKLSNIFNQFYRCDESRNSTKDGNGLGLYICKYIIESLQGKINAENDDGLKIIILLPYIK